MTESDRKSLKRTQFLCPSGESEEDLMDEKGVVKRKSRNLSEKKRRDQFNVLIGELCTMVCSGKRKMDKSTVLKTAIAFIQNHNQISAELQGQEITEDWKPSFLSNEEFTHLILEALDGFILVFGIDGKIVYSSENITSLLGHLPNDLLGRSIYDFTLADDKRNLAQILQHPDLIDGSASADNPVTFSCHFRRGTKPHIYEVVDITGYFRTQHGTRPCSPADSTSTVNWMDDSSATYSDRGASSSVVFVASGRLQSPQLLSEKSLVDAKSEFTSRHSLEWKFLFLDHRAPPIIGYLPFEVLGTSGYDYYHIEDLEKVASAHEILMQKGEGTSCYYRFLTKGQQWIWLQTRYYISYHQWNSKPEFIVCTHRVVSYNEVVGRPVIVKNESPASCLSTGGRPRNSSESRSSSRNDREEGRAQLRSITKRTDAPRVQGPPRFKVQEQVKRPRSRASNTSQPPYDPPPSVSQRESYPDSSAYTPVPPLEQEDPPVRTEPVNYEFQQPTVPVIAYKSEPRPETPQFQAQQYQSSPSFSYRSSDRMSIGSTDQDPPQSPCHNAQSSEHQVQTRPIYRVQSDQMSTGSNESRHTGHRPEHPSYQTPTVMRQPPSDAVSVGSSDSLKSHYSVQSDHSSRQRCSQPVRHMVSPTFERQGDRVRVEGPASRSMASVVVSGPQAYMGGFPVSQSQLVQIRQGSSLVTVALPPGTVMTKNSASSGMTSRRQESSESVEVQQLYQRSPDRRASVVQPPSQHVPVSFHSSMPMVVDMSGNTVPVQVPFAPFSVQGESQRVQIIDGVPMMTLPMVRGLSQPMVMTAAQKQLHEQLQQKHAGLQRQLLQQQEELRKISEQLLFSQFGGWGPPVVKMAVQYEEGEPSGHSGAPQPYRQRHLDRDEEIEYRSTVPVIQNVYHVRQDGEHIQYMPQGLNIPQHHSDTSLDRR